MTEMIGLLHPGEMGTAVGVALSSGGHAVGWASEGRSPATTKRADAAGFTDLRSIENLVQRCDIIISVCPPQFATETASHLHSFAGVYVDANAISPRTAGEIIEMLGARGADYVDAGIIGVPPRAAGDTRIYLAGERAEEVRELFEGSLFAPIVVGENPTSASALKMSYAAWTKISAALLLAIKATATDLDVDGFLAREWQISQPALADRVLRAQASATAKGWRWVAEMEEIATAFADAGAPAGFGEAAAAVYRDYGRPPASE